MKNEEKKSTREVGSNFDKSDAEKIFDALDRVEAKEKREVSDNMKKGLNQTKEVSDLIQDAQSLMLSDKYGEAISILKNAIAINPDNGEAYILLADAYQMQDDSENEIKILKTAISNVKSDTKAKNELMKRLKEMN
ncbi:MAG: tetratricopeptide repeat protein [Methanobrevibacter sp.]|uniref:tetratricopeptide repeat protein n=1 Tax=Methanobrevibacter sp. TaxID=66852 RepID=UPI0025E2ACCB|nr:tetratricopeptide repeat protein [Methanobrevibacter sp.]MBQ6100169.1 tetratricopeptide repeat protein [Methanobrevibacter sp.]